MSEDKAIVSAPSTDMRPAHLRGDIKGVEQLDKIVKPPLLKIVQKQSADELIDAYGKGTTLVMPARAVVAHVSEPFHFAPIFYYREFVTWAPIEAKGQLPPILAKSYDENSPIAMKAQDPDQREEVLEIKGKEWKIRHQEHLNFIVVLKNHPMGEEPMILSFARGEYKTGMALASKIKMRHASIFDCVFQARVSTEPRSNQSGSWHGWDITDPTDPSVSPWSTAEESAKYAVLHEDMATKYQAGHIETEYDDASSGNVTEVAPSEDEI